MRTSMTKVGMRMGTKIIAIYEIVNIRQLMLPIIRGTHSIKRKPQGLKRRRKETVGFDVSEPGER